MAEDRLARYDYDLPPDRIAQQPAMPRDASRLMVLAGRRPPAHHRFTDLPQWLRPTDLLVRNDTRVIPARLHGRRPGGGKTELLLVHRSEAAGQERWLCLARPASHLKPGKEVTFGAGELTAVVQDKGPAGKVEVTFRCAENRSFADLLAALGETPLPPYIDRSAGGPTAADRERYQTTYARADGAVAAPTAGLHFTAAVDAALARRGVEIATLTLHVGPGTFRPIQAERLSEHAMDAEYGRIPEAVAARITAARSAGRRIVAVGTTTTRALETATDAQGTTRPWEGWTDLFLRPGHVFCGIDGLLTNFHLPRSSLLVLVSALAGRERILATYQEAIDAGYRFYSYGDAMLILPAG